MLSPAAILDLLSGAAVYARWNGKRGTSRLVSLRILYLSHTEMAIPRACVCGEAQWFGFLSRLRWGEESVFRLGYA